MARPVRGYQSPTSSDTSLPDEALSQLDEVSKIEQGFPHDFLNSSNIQHIVYGSNRDLDGRLRAAP